MNLLVTAGNTQVLIDRVRCLSNVFTGRTGARLALDAHARGHTVTLLTSHPDTVDDLAEPGSPPPPERWTVRRYRTFDDLQERMEEALRRGGFDGVIHSAAVSDYLTGGIYSPADGSRFRPEDGHWLPGVGGLVLLEDRAAGKVKSDESELWLRLVRAPKLIDRVRGDWGFRGVLVKFKLEVGISEEQLLKIAEASRVHSDADLMVANTLEGAAHWAYVGPVEGKYQRLVRRDLSDRLLDAVEALHREKAHA
jgi:phosphopantothenate---cysteine ligase (CTP)